jgi:hypothetical protein
MMVSGGGQIDAGEVSPESLTDAGVLATAAAASWRRLLDRGEESDGEILR